MQDILRTFEVEEDIGLVILEHLGDELHIHVLDIDLLQKQRRVSNAHARDYPERI